MKAVSLFLEDHTGEIEACVHCGQPISPCTCTCAPDVHWQDAAASPGHGSLHCLGMPHQLHEPSHV